MKNSWKPALIFMVVVPLIYIAQTLTMSFFPKDWQMEPLWPTYAFLFILYEVVFVFLVWLERKHPQQLGFGFLGGGVFKMMAVVIYLLPGLLNDVPDIKARVVHTMIPYFLFLTLETTLVFRRIRTVV